MIILYMILYYIFAIGLIAAVVFLTVRQAKRRRDAKFAKWEQSIQRWRESTPPLPPPLPPVEFDEGIEDEEEIDDEDIAQVTDLNAPALQPIAPLLRRAAKEYLDNPADRERILRALSEALGVSPQPT